MIRPLVKVNVPFIVGVVLTVRSFDALLITRLLNVVVLVPPIAGVAPVPVKVTVPVFGVKVPLLVQFPPAFPAPTLSAKAPFSTSAAPVLIVRSLRMFVVAPSCTEGFPAVTRTRFQMLTGPPRVLVRRNGFPATPPTWRVPPVMFWVADRMFRSFVEALPICTASVPPDMLKVVALPSTKVSCVFAPTLAIVTVPPVCV